jgi:hypothetical protein
MWMDLTRGQYPVADVNMSGPEISGSALRELISLMTKVFYPF